MTANYGERDSDKRTGGPGSGAITNDDKYILDIPEKVDIEKLKKADKHDRSY